MKSGQRKAAASGGVRDRNQGNCQQNHSIMNTPQGYPLPDALLDGPFLHTLLMFLARLDFPMSGDGWLVESLTLNDVTRAVNTCNLARVPINAAIDAHADDDGAKPISCIDGVSVALFDGRIELAIDGSTRVLLAPGRKATVQLEELRPDQMAGGFRLWSPEGLEMNIERADAGATS